MSKTSVILPSGRGEFRRTVRDADGKPVLDDAGNPRVLKFQPGQPLELDADELEAVRDDIGNILQIAKLDKDTKPVAKADGEATAKFVKETADRKAKAAKEAAAEVEAAKKPAKRAPAEPSHATHAPHKYHEKK